MNEPTELRFYNPGWLSDEALIASFTARQALFEFLRDELRRAPRQGTVQHYLLVGVRGAGKTTLLQRLAVAIRQDTDLADHLLGLSFPEELYAIKGLADFWWAACEALVDALERRGRRAEADALDAQIEGRRAQQRTAGLHDDSGLRLLKQVCEALQLRPVLLLDNLDQLLERLAKSGRKKDLLTPAYWALREALSSADAPLLIGASVRLSEPFTDYDKAFYDFFVPQRLDRLSLDEVQAVFDRLAEGHGGAALRERIRARPGRVRALYELTGGNPRALGLLFELLRQGTHARAVDDFERLMDQTTPYYKARFEELPEQAQLVMHALATARRDRSALDFGHTAAALAEHCGLDTRTVSAQLDVLINAGLVEKDSPASGRMRYRIAEQLFRLWLQMRGSRRIRQQVITLTEFIEALYDSEEREALLRSTYDRLTASHDSLAKLQWALGELQPSAADRRCLQSYATDTLLASAEHRTRFDAILAPGDLPVELEWLAQARQQLLAALPRLQSLGFSEQHLEALLGALTLDEDSKRTHVARLLDPATAAEELAGLRPQLGDESQLLRDFGLSDSDIRFLHRERSCGRLLLKSLSPGDRELRDDAQRRELVWTLLGAGGIPITTAAQAEAWLTWSKEQFADASSEEWAAFADRLRKAGQTAAAQAAVDTALARGESAEAWFQQAALLHDADPAAAEAAYRKAIDLDPQNARLWHNLGVLLVVHLQRYHEAEAAYRKTIDLNPQDAWLWNNLGNLLADHLQRYDEAETAYRKAIDLNPQDASPWNNLGNLLANYLQRYHEAEAAFRKAIDLDPRSVWPWISIGILLADYLQRYDEAEAAFRKAIDLDPRSALPWKGLGLLLADHLQRYDEAEAAYRNAIDLDPQDAWPWNNLGILFADHLQRYDEAEAAYRKAIDLDPQDAWPWNRLGILLADHLQRYDEAEAAYRKAIDLDPRSVWPWKGLGLLLADHLQRYDEAEAAYRKAIDLDPQDAWPWNNLGNLLADHLQRYDEAETAFRKAIDLDPRSVLAWNNLGKLLAARLQRYDEAEAAYRKAIDLDPQDASPWKGLGTLLAAHLQRYDEAEAAYRKAIDLDPRSVLAWNNLGKLLAARLQRYDEAEAAYRKAIDLDPQDASPWKGLGTLLAAHLQRYDEAEAAYRKAIDLNPRYALPWHNLGILFAEHLQRYDEAEAAFRKAAELTSDDHDTRAALLCLQTLNALSAGDECAVRQHLGALLTDVPDVEAYLADPFFVEILTGHALHSGRGPQLLALLRELGFERYAAPLLLALAAAVTDNAAGLEKVEPELRSAAQTLFERLQAVRPADQPEGEA